MILSPQNLLVYAASIGYRLFSEGYSFIISRMTLCAPSYIMAYMRSSSLPSSMMLKRRSAVASFVESPLPPWRIMATSLRMRKCLRAYIMSSVKTAGALYFSVSVQLMRLMASSLIGNVFLNARNSRSIFENYMLNSLKSATYSANIFSKKCDLMNCVLRVCSWLLSSASNVLSLISFFLT